MYVNNLIINIFKYLLYGIIISIIINIIPQEKLPISDNLIMIIFMIITFILLDFICPKKELFINDNNNELINNDNIACPCNNIQENFNDPDIENEPEDIENKETNEKGIVRPQPKNNLKHLNDKDDTIKNKPKDVEIVDENIYSDYIMKPLGEYTDDFTNQWKHGWTYLNTDKWTVPMDKPPVCIMPEGKESTYQPRSSDNTANLLEWNYARRITQPMDINTAYIKNILNEQPELPKTE